MTSDHPAEGDGSTPDVPTEASAEAPVIPVTVAPVPATGVWVGPREEPARYERLEHVGGGAEGAVYRARFVGLGTSSTRIVALKEYRRPQGAPPSWPHDGTWVTIADQAGLLMGLESHPHLVRVQGVFLGAVSSSATDRDPSSPNKVFGTPYLVMDWIEGRDPARELAARRVPLAERAAWITDLAQAVDLLHSVSRTAGNPLVHGDVKPGNCLVTPGRGLVLVDTGAMTRLDASGTHRGLCSPPYAAPEVLAAPGRPRDPTADLFSVAAVAFLILTGAPPPSADTAGYLEEATVRLEATPWPGVRAARRNAAHRLLLTYLAPDPAVRRTIALSSWSRQLGELLTPRRPRRRTVLAWAAAATACVSTVGALTFASGSRPTPPRSSPAVPGGTPTHGRRVLGDFAVFGRRWVSFPATTSADALAITPPAGDHAFDHLWGFYLPAQACTPTVEFDARATPADGVGNYGIAVAVRAGLEGDQPVGPSVQWESEGADVTAHPGPYVRPADLPGGAWTIEVAPTPAPDLRQEHHVRVSAVGASLDVAVDGRTIASYTLPGVRCGGVAIRVWGAPARLRNVKVTDG